MKHSNEIIRINDENNRYKFYNVVNIEEIIPCLIIKIKDIFKIRDEFIKKKR